jgi:hypothetical protein
MKKSTSFILGYFVIMNLALLSIIFGNIVFQISNLFSNLGDVFGLLFVIIIATVMGILAIIILSHIILSCCYLPAYFQSNRINQPRWLGFTKIANLSLGTLYIVFSLIYAFFMDIKDLLPLPSYVKVLWVMVAISMLLVGYFTFEPQSKLAK